MKLAAVLAITGLLVIRPDGVAAQDPRPPRDTTVVRIDSLLISSTRTGRRLEDEPLRVEVVGREEIEEKLRMTPGDIAMLLNETGGVRVQATAPALGGASVRIQGMRGRYAQLLADGLPLYGEASGLGPLQIPPMDLGRVEVIKGTASALYGAAALGGVINLISRHPDGATELLLNRTSRGGTDAVIWAASADEARVGWTMTAGVHDQGRVDVDGDGWADIPGYTRYTARPRIFLGGPRGSLMLTAGAAAEDRRGGGVSGPVAGVRQGLDSRRADGGAVGALWLGRIRVTGRASLAEQRHTHIFADTDEEDVHRALFAEIALAADWRRHTIVGGAALHRDTYHNDQRPAYDVRTTTPGIFVQDEWRVSDRLAVSTSARVDRPGDHGVLISPRVSALLRAGEWSIRASAGGGHHVPHAWIEEIDAIGLAALSAREELAVERARTASLDVGRTLGALEVNATVFGSIVRDAVALRHLEGGGLAVANVRGDTRTHGTELLVRLHAESVHATLSYAWTRAMEPDPDAARGTRRESALTPEHTAGLVVAWEDEDRGRIGAEVYYTGTQALHDDPYRDRSRAYTVYGVLAERRIGRARVFVNFENIGDVRQTRHAPLLLPARTPEGRHTTDAWAPLDGRVINAGVRFSLAGPAHDEH
jgi:outer membrane receptor for ferrienterochelin and colicins